MPSAIKQKDGSPSSPMPRPPAGWLLFLAVARTLIGHTRFVFMLLHDVVVPAESFLVAEPELAPHAGCQRGERLFAGRRTAMSFPSIVLVTLL